MVEDETVLSTAGVASVLLSARRFVGEPDSVGVPVRQLRLNLRNANDKADPKH